MPDSDLEHNADCQPSPSQDPPASHEPSNHSDPRADPRADPNRWTRDEWINAAGNIFFVLLPLYVVVLAAFAFSLFSFCHAALSTLPEPVGWALLAIAAVGALVTVWSFWLPRWSQSAGAATVMLVPQVALLAVAFFQGEDAATHLRGLLAGSISTAILITSVRVHSRQFGWILDPRPKGSA